MIEPSMLVIQAKQLTRDNTETMSFRLIPLTNDCPYLMAEWDIKANQLMLLCKDFKQELRSIPKIDKYGNYIKHATTNDMEVERRNIEDWFEIYLSSEKGVKAFIEAMCINASDTDTYMPYISQMTFMSAPAMEAPKSSLILS